MVMILFDNSSNNKKLLDPLKRNIVVIFFYCYQLVTGAMHEKV